MRRSTAEFATFLMSLTRRPVFLLSLATSRADRMWSYSARSSRSSPMVFWCLQRWGHRVSLPSYEAQVGDRALGMAPPPCPSGIQRELLMTLAHQHRRAQAAC